MPANLGELVAAYRPNGVPLRDYVVRDDGAGPFIAYWDAVALGVAMPTEAQVLTFKATYDAGQPKRDGAATLLAISQEWCIAQMVNAQFGDNTRLLAVNAKITAWKNAHPGVVP